MTQTYDYDWREDVEGQPTEDNEAIEVQAIAPSTQVQDDDDEYEIEPPRKLTDRPVLLITIVSGGLLGGVIILVGVIWAATSVSGFVSSEKTKKDRVTAETAAINSPFDREDSISETEQLRQRLSSKNRDAELAAFNQQAKNPKATPTPTPSPTPIAKVTTPQRTVQAPKVIYRPAPPRPQPQKQVAPPPPAPRPAPRPSPVKAPKPVRPKKPIDPFEQWEKLANLGSIGGGDIVASASPSGYSEQGVAYVDPSGPAVPVFNPLADSEAEDYEVTETPASPFSLALGTTIKGKLMHDITFVDGSISTETAVVELMERMGTIPQGAMVSTQINGVDDSGALSMDILGYEVDGEYSSVSLPEIQVTSAPASTKKNGLGRLLTDVAGIGLDILSSETGQKVEFDNGRISSISTNSDSGILDRSVEAFSSRLLERNRSRSSSKKAPRVKRGSIVRFIVVKPMG